jgi:hypothetical protein
VERIEAYTALPRGSCIAAFLASPLSGRHRLCLDVIALPGGQQRTAWPAVCHDNMIVLRWRPESIL